MGYSTLTKNKKFPIKELLCVQTVMEAAVSSGVNSNGKMYTLLCDKFGESSNVSISDAVAFFNSLQD